MPALDSTPALFSSGGNGGAKPRQRKAEPARCQPRRLARSFGAWDANRRMQQPELRRDEVLTDVNSEANTPEDAAALHNFPDHGHEPDEPVTVAVVDSGIHADAVADHPWFENAEVVDRHDTTDTDNDGDDIGHGTAVASIYGRVTPKVELISVRIFGGGGRASGGSIAQAYSYLLDNADRIDVVNNSWGYTQNVPRVNQRHERLLSRGVFDATAAGNTGGRGGSPSTAERAFSAGAVDGDGEVARFSSHNPNRDNPDVAALGVNVKLARAPDTSMGQPLNGSFVKASGTSFAAPYTGAAVVNAIYHARDHNWTRRLEATAGDLPGTQRDGEGLLDLRAAVAATGDTDEEPEATPGSAWNFNGRDSAYIDANWLPEGDVTVERVEDDGEGVTLRFVPE